MGFKTSLFERLFNLPLYQRNTLTGRYNRKYITQLTKNYRSHPAILKIPNELFYENALQAMASPGRFCFIKKDEFHGIILSIIFSLNRIDKTGIGGVSWIT